MTDPLMLASIRPSSTYDGRDGSGAAILSLARLSAILPSPDRLKADTDRATDEIGPVLQCSGRQLPGEPRRAYGCTAAPDIFLRPKLTGLMSCPTACPTRAFLPGTLRGTRSLTISHQAAPHRHERAARRSPTGRARAPFPPTQATAEANSIKDKRKQKDKRGDMGGDTGYPPSYPHPLCQENGSARLNFSRPALSGVPPDKYACHSIYTQEKRTAREL